jgi:hypothetical protein
MEYLGLMDEDGMWTKSAESGGISNHKINYYNGTN